VLGDRAARDCRASCGRAFFRGRVALQPHQSNLSLIPTSAKKQPCADGIKRRKHYNHPERK
jgi:hypothetical protein